MKKSHICQYCGKVYSHHSSRFRHEKKCSKLTQSVSKNPAPVRRGGGSGSTPSKSKLFAKTKPRIVPKIKDQQPIDDESITISTEFMHQLIHQMKMMESRLDKVQQEVQQQPRNIINYTVQIFGGDNIYSDLTTKIGKEPAIKLLMDAAAKNNPQKVLEQYFDRSQPNAYPIACANREGTDGFRYYDSDNQIVNDKEGQITQVLTQRIQTAMLHAANALITQCISEGNIDQLYDMYDIGSVQRNLATMNSSDIKGALVNLTFNPQHQLFRDDIEPMITINS